MLDLPVYEYIEVAQEPAMIINLHVINLQAKIYTKLQKNNL